MLAHELLRQAALILSDGDLSLSLRSRLLPPDDQEGNEESPVTAVLTGRPSMLRPEMKSPTAVAAALIKTTVSQQNGSKGSRPTASCQEQHHHDGREQD